MTLFIEYTKEQERALTQLRRAFTRCKKAKLTWFNQYGTLQFYPFGIIEVIDDRETGICAKQYDVGFEEISLGVGEWSDDKHFVHFTEEGIKKYKEGLQELDALPIEPTGKDGED